jgi:hypothetical protein
MAIYGRNWVMGIGRTRTETVFYWKNVGKKPYRNVGKKNNYGLVLIVFPLTTFYRKNTGYHTQKTVTDHRDEALPSKLEQ